MGMPKRSQEELEKIVRDSPLSCQLHSFQGDEAVFYFVYKEEPRQVIYPRKVLDDAGIKAGMRFQIHYSIENGDIKLSFVPMPPKKREELPPDFKWLTAEEKMSAQYPWEKED